MIDKKIFLIIILGVILFSSAFYASYQFFQPEETEPAAIVSVNESVNVTPEVKTEKTQESGNKYFCRQCNQYHPQPVDVYHRYGNCPICGKWVDTKTTSHMHDSDGRMWEEPA
ncbi:MAG: hypothetical protein AB1604_00005 [Euryarchaeota archaeon]